MKNKIFFGSAITVLCGLVLPPVCVPALAAPASETMTSRLPADLARADAGTRIEVRGASTAPAELLLGNDVAAAYSLPAGTTSMILSLSKIEIVNHFDFVNLGAEGKVTVSVSSAKLPADSKEWREVVGAQAFAGRQLVPCDLGSVEARYVKIDFSANTAGRIAGFNLFGLSGASVSKADSKGKFHVSLSTPASANVEASFVFDAANPEAKVVADLGASKSLERLTCAYEAPAGSLEFYFVDSLSESERVSLNYVGEPSVQPVSNDTADSGNVLASHKAIYTVDTAEQPGSGKVSANLDGLQGRYLVAAFRPAARHRATDGKDGKDTKDFANSAVEGKDKDSKAAPVFPFFTSNPSGFGNSPADSNTPLTPPPIGANSP